MQRLFDGQPSNSTGALTVVQLAAEAGVKRWVLTHKHPDLRIEFESRRHQVNGIPAAFQNIQARSVDLETANQRLRAETRNWPNASRSTPRSSTNSPPRSSGYAPPSGYPTTFDAYPPELLHPGPDMTTHPSTQPRPGSKSAFDSVLAGSLHHPRNVAVVATSRSASSSHG